MQHEVKDIQKLLDKNGHISEPGWARRPVWQYDRRDIKMPTFRIKEWDYYLALSDTHASAFTISDLGYAGMISVSVIDLKEAKEHTETILIPLTLGKMGLRAASASGDAEYRNNRLHIKVETRPGMRRLRCIVKDFYEGQPLSADLLIKQPDMESMCIATPFKENKKAFYYNQKINCMPVKGSVVIGDKVYKYKGTRDMAVLDWGRGVWTYDNTWYWGTCACRIGDKPFGFNLGYGFSDRSSASENLIYYENKVHKLEDITFHIEEDEDGAPDFMKPWTITSSDGRFEAIFMPILNRKAFIDLKVFTSDQNQIFGHITGTAILDDGSEIKMRDIIAAVEVVHNKY